MSEEPRPSRPLIEREADGPTLLREATHALEMAGSATPRLDAETLLAAMLGTRVTTLRTAVAAGFPLPLPTLIELPEPEPFSERHPQLAESLRIARSALAAGDAAAALAALVQERAAGRPISHLTGRRGFRRLEFLVTPDVLDPRPESELIIDSALAFLRDRVAADRALGRAPHPLNAAEIGTGSGALAVTLADESPVPLRLVATDISGDALIVARSNALRCGVASRITFMHGDLAEPLLAARAPGDPAHLDLLIANLPYVPSAEVDAAKAAASIRELAPRDLSRLAIAAEPRLALDGGVDGLELIRRVIAELPRLLRPGGVALLEFGDGQGDAVVRLAEGLGIGWRVAIRGDLSGRERMAEIRRSG
ncbi:MAG: peptide chain release factor N(5)-glutamine methyltransferase [Chloroflexi bacterium]|jgi:release factor glutamine methyltransferase|nr:peptide chain release factor N(5)-glutamine methyltransferase [Chloroflexota bacterium]